MTRDEAFGFELLAAVEALRPDAAPLAAALIRGVCIRVPVDAYGPLLAALDSLGGVDLLTSSDAAQGAMLDAWRGAQARVGGGQVGAPEAWQALADMGLWQQACAAVIFGLSVTTAALHAVSADERALVRH